ncbi:hypothetical protein [Tenacibaculum sp. C7A-26P2]|uniref:hypothetical protein n=1 Tax=Tenacibaculum sp. C7A-26P2 TaxID=3447504 RepID=UPI003F82E447
MGSPYKYIERINGIISEKGVPKLSPKELKRLLKIVALEYHERALRAKYKENVNQHEIFLIGMKITDLTGNISPDKLIEEMVRLSRHHL